MISGSFDCSLGRVQVGAQLLRLAEVDVGGAGGPPGRSSGRAPGSPAPSPRGRRARDCRAAAPRSRPTARAPTAGNWALRSSVQVRITETKSSAASALRLDQLAHQLLGRAEDRRLVVALGLHGAAHGPEPARVVSGRSSAGSFQSRRSSAARSRRDSPGASSPSRSGPERDPLQRRRPRCRSPRPSAAPGGCGPRGS